MFLKSNKNFGVFFVCILCVLYLASCRPSLLKYKIDDSYVGPVVVFIYSDVKGPESNNLVIINRDGLGRVRSGQLKSKFTFVSDSMETEIPIIEIGREMEADEEKRGVYGLVKGHSSAKCSTHSLSIVVFFVGRKSDFENWRKMHVSEFKYLDKKGIDWCSFYKKQFK